MHRAADDDLARVSRLPVSPAECSTRAPTLGIRPARRHEAVVPDASQDLCTSLEPPPWDSWAHLDAELPPRAGDSVRAPAAGPGPGADGYATGCCWVTQWMPPPPRPM